ncbi:MAG: hypothetical protein HY319_27455 [Armatimonadetes bacterium]|nr:hypothetical protein [Armatimonadota bacterium]
MAQDKSRGKSRPASSSKSSKPARPEGSRRERLPNAAIYEELERVREEARRLEAQLEEELLRDAVLSARIALEELHNDTHGPPHERRRGIRLREKALKVEKAFNRLRALRRGEMLPPREADE